MKERRNLSGIYIRHQDKDTKKYENICFEDLDQDEQYNWMNSLDEDGVKRLVIILADTLNEIGDQLDLVKE